MLAVATGSMLLQLVIYWGIDIGSRLARRLQNELQEILLTASRVGSTDMLNIAKRLQFTVLRAFTLPCCLEIGDFHDNVAPFRCENHFYNPSANMCTYVAHNFWLLLLS